MFAKEIFHLTATFPHNPNSLAVQLHREAYGLEILGKIFVSMTRDDFPTIIKITPFSKSSQIRYVISRLTLWKYRQELVPDDCLTIYCKLVATGIKKVPSTRDGESRDILVRDFGSLLTSEINSDVDIQVEGQTIKAHSQILSARSSVFAAMFRHNMKERQSGILNITDLRASTMQSLLRYIYTGDMPNIKDLSPDLLMELYVAADKYCIFDLKMTCSQTITDGMTKENAKLYTVLAIKYDDQMIMDEAVSFLAKTIKIIS